MDAFHDKLIVALLAESTVPGRGRATTPSLREILNQEEHNKEPWDGWPRLIPTTLREVWGELSARERVIAFAVAANGLWIVHDLLDRNE